MGTATDRGCRRYEQLIQVLDIGTIINYTPVEHNQCKNSKMSFRFYLSDECSMSIYHAWYCFDPLI